MDRLIAIGAGAGAVLAILGLAALVGRRLRKGWGRLDAFLEDWNGTPERPGRKRIPSMPERVAELEHGLAAVRAQVTPNGGNSKRLGDRMVRVERALGTDPNQQQEGNQP